MIHHIFLFFLPRVRNNNLFNLALILLIGGGVIIAFCNQWLSRQKFYILEYYRHYKKHGNLNKASLPSFYLDLDTLISYFTELPSIEENQEFYSYPEVNNCYTTLEGWRKVIRIIVKFAFPLSFLAFIFSLILH